MIAVRILSFDLGMCFRFGYVGFDARLRYWHVVFLFFRKQVRSWVLWMQGTRWADFRYTIEISVRAGGLRVLR